jgi:hypothetical protein
LGKGKGVFWPLSFSNITWHDSSIYRADPIVVKYCFNFLSMTWYGLSSLPKNTHTTQQAQHHWNVRRNNICWTITLTKLLFCFFWRRYWHACELKALRLLGRYPTTWAVAPALFCFSYLFAWSQVFAQASLRPLSFYLWPIYALPSIWDHSCKPPHPACCLR